MQSAHPDMFGQNNSNIKLVDTAAALTCLDRVEGQPTYLEMFQYSIMSTVQGPVVALANTDQAFDSSLRIATSLQPNGLVVLSTVGYDTLS